MPAPPEAHPRAVPARGRDLAAVVLSLAALIAAAYHRVLFFGETFVERDALRFTLPSRQFLASSLRDGRIPEWFDGVGLGAPFAANPVHEVFAPLGWTMALVPTSFGFDLYNLVHILIGTLGVAAFARRLGAGAAGSVVAGASLGLGGYVTSMVPNGLAPALAWTPWVVWAAHRLESSLAGESRAQRWRAGAVFAACFSLQVFAGEPASLLIAALAAWIVVALGASRTLYATGVAALSAAASLALAALAAVPGLFLLADSARAAGLDRGGLEWSLHPARLLELVWPMAFGSQLGDGWYAGLLLREGPGDPYWSFSLFMGLPVLLCLGVALRERYLRRMVLASLPFLLLAAGPLTPVYPVLLKLFPPLGLVNFPEKLVYGALLFWAAAAGVGFSRLIEEGPSRRIRMRSVAGAALLTLGLTALLFSRVPLAQELSRRAAEWGVLVHAEVGVVSALRGAFVAVLGAVLFAFAARSRTPRRASAMGLVAVLGPLLWAVGQTTPYAPRSVVAETPEVLRALAPFTAKPEAPRPRLFRIDPLEAAGPFSGGAQIARSYHESIETNIASRFGVDVIPGFEPGESERSRRFGREVLPRMSGYAMVALLGVEWVAAQDPESRGLPFVEAARGADGWALLSTGTVRPRAFVTPRFRGARDFGDALDALTGPGRKDEAATVMIVDPDDGLSATAAPPSPCQVRVPRPEEVRLACASPGGGYAVLLEEWSPGWTATVGGRDAEVRLADGLFRAVAVGPGSHEVVFRYRTPGLRAGAALSLAAWLAWLVGMVRTRRFEEHPCG